MPNRSFQRRKLVLLVSHFDNPVKDCVATSLAWMCKEKGVEFDAYYTANRDDGGIFSPHGSGVVGGRHTAAIARALAEFETTVVQLGHVYLLHTLIPFAACSIVEDQGNLASLYQQIAAMLKLPLPTTIVAIQTKGLPEGLQHGIVRMAYAREGHKLTDDRSVRSGSIIQYTFPEVVYRQALAVPLELEANEIVALKKLGVTTVWTVATSRADTSAWARAGFTIHAAEVLQPDDTYTSFTFRIAERWLNKAQAIDLCEPLLASHLLPFAVREDRLLVCGTTMKEGIEKLAPLVAAKGQKMVYGRYAGGALRGAVADEDLFLLFRQNIPFQVIEPGRPVLTIFARYPAPLPQPEQSVFDLEPSDDELRTWVREGRKLITILTHSGELSHNDAIINMIDLAIATGVKSGIGVQYPRYIFDPEVSELMQVPVKEGGALGLVEPVLHSAGFGIHAEALGDPQCIADLMKEARDKIAAVAGERFAPRGVYLYCDAEPPHWQRRAEKLWQAIKDAGFEYVISSVSCGMPQVLYQDGDFIVLNQYGKLHYPYSPFVRIDDVHDLIEIEQRLLALGDPSWILAVLDIPIYAYSSYLSLGDPFKNRGGLGQFYAFIRKGGNSGQLISATPRTIARYARMVADISKHVTSHNNS